MFMLAYSIFTLAYQYHSTGTLRYVFVRRLASFARHLERHAPQNGFILTSGMHVPQGYVGKQLEQLKGCRVHSDQP
jgi:hypothetical protein